MQYRTSRFVITKLIFFNYFAFFGCHLIGVIAKLCHLFQICQLFVMAFSIIINTISNSTWMKQVCFRDLWKDRNNFKKTYKFNNNDSSACKFHILIVPDTRQLPWKHPLKIRKELFPHKIMIKNYIWVMNVGICV